MEGVTIIQICDNRRVVEEIQATVLSGKLWVKGVPSIPLRPNNDSPPSHALFADRIVTQREAQAIFESWATEQADEAG